MSIQAAFMVPHPPMIVPQVGRGSEAQIEATAAAYDRVAEEMRKTIKAVLSRPKSMPGRAFYPFLL